MKKVKRIIVGIDIFEKSDNVLKRALILAKRNKAELFIVHAVQRPWLSIPSYFGGREITIDKKGIEDKIEKKIQALNTDDKISYLILVREGKSYDILQYESKLLKADMIIIGSHSKAKGKKRFLGTTAHNIAHKSHLPVLIVKNSPRDSYKNIVIPTDFQLQSKQSIVFTKNIFPTAKISIVHASEIIYIDGPYSIVASDLSTYNEVAKACAKKDLKDFMENLSLKKGKIIDGGVDNKAALLKYIKKDSYDLVVVGSRGTAGFNALLGSVASYILREVSNDVLVYVPVD